ncbi:MAG: dTDP-4-amino-4,6-dideoxygalactose transaminase [Proteobacteria bacterium SG_bin7]|nr:MAG: dTDP-4-amino-4,6-dideoxygalactose transaminase [Proteobacteria bacterium SG_bin7]
MDNKKIPFSRASISGLEEKYVIEALRSGHLCGDGSFTKKCHAWLEKNVKTKKALLTHSCTAALEMSALLSDLKHGDEVIMPSFTFVSTANAIVLRGAVPVFVEIRSDTLNIDETKIEAAITNKTKAIMVVHYAGVSCEMDTILEIAKRKNLLVFEDAAQGMNSKYKGKFLGTIGDLGSLSFHDTKNIVAGEGGALLINSSDFIKRAEILREKGTNRSQFFRGEVDKYSWMDVGSSYLPSDILAALLLAQLERSNEITERRSEIWNKYNKAFENFEGKEIVSRPVVPEHCEHNAHIFYLLMQNLEARTKALEVLKAKGIAATFHYVPLHSSPGGKKFGRAHGDLSITNSVSERILRLPLWPDMPNSDMIVDLVTDVLKSS